jgi:hypothetical protein
LCNPRGHDVGEYVRTVFDNFLFLEKDKTENGSARLKAMFQPFLEEMPRRWNNPLLKWAR